MQKKMFVIAAIQYSWQDCGRANSELDTSQIEWKTIMDFSRVCEGNFETSVRLRHYQ